MREEGEGFFENDETQEMVIRFENMLKKNQHYFFDVFELVSIIDYYLEIGKFEAANQAVTFGCSMHPDSVELLTKKAQVLVNHGRPMEALPILRKLEKIEMSNPEIFILLGTVYNQIGNEREAVKHFDKSIELAYEEREDIYLNIAAAFQQTKNTPFAIKFLLKAYREFPDNEDILFELAFCYEKLEQYEECIKFYQEYLDINPFSENVWYNLGIIYNKTEQYDKAIEAYDYAIAIEEDYSSAYFNKANTLANADKYKDAIKVYHEFLQFDQQYELVYYYLGECYEKTGEYEMAVKYYLKTIELEEDFADAWYGIALINYFKQDLKNSIDHLKKAIKIDEENADYWFLMAKITSELSLHKQAAYSFKKAANLDPFDTELWIGYADFVYKHGKTIDAIKILEDLEHLISHSAKINYRLTVYCLNAKKYKKAFVYFDKGLQLDYNQHKDMLMFYPDAELYDQIRKLIKQYKK